MKRRGYWSIHWFVYVLLQQGPARHRAQFADRGSAQRPRTLLTVLSPPFAELPRPLFVFPKPSFANTRAYRA